jgi:hypothetical protein
VSVSHPGKRNLPIVHCSEAQVQTDSATVPLSTSPRLLLKRLLATAAYYACCALLRTIADSKWKGDIIPPARAVLATDLGGADVKFTVTCIAATKDSPAEHLGTAGDVHGPVRHNGRLYISGIVGIVDTDGNVIENEDDMGDQTARAMARVGQTLAEYGASPQTILSSVSCCG